MLSELPKETLSIILDFLTFQDRLNLVRTCRHWRDLISERHLYEELPTFKNEDKLQDALDSFRSNPVYGSQVKRLHIKLAQITKDISMQLPFVFPNIKEFRTDNPWLRLEPEIRILLKWKDTLELFHGENGICIGGLLARKTFSRLSSLTMSLPISFFNVYTDIRDNMTVDSYITFDSNSPRDFDSPFSTHLTENRQVRNMIQNGDRSFTKHSLQFFDCFKNAPSLTHLELHGGYLFLQYLERLHVVCPHLASLNISVNIFVGDIDALPSFIEPAIRLRSLKIDTNSSINNENNRILDYLIAKYTNLSEFMFLTRYLDDGPIDIGGTYQQHHYNRKESIRKRREFISRLPSTIKTLKLNVFGFEDPIGALQESALDPVELALYTTNKTGELIPASVIMHPSHFNYIQSLKSLESLTLEWNSIMENNICGTILDNISDLTVQIPIKASDTYEDTSVSIISVCPSLKCLKITSESMSSNELPLVPINGTLSKIIHSKLRKLSLDQSFLSVKLIERICTSFPNMKELELKFWYSSMYNGAQFDIDLKRCDLNILSLVVNNRLQGGSYIIFYLQVKTLDNLKSYRVKLVSSGEIGYITEVEEVPPSTKKIIRVICDGIKMLKINDMNAKLSSLKL